MCVEAEFPAVLAQLHNELIEERNALHLKLLNTKPKGFLAEEYAVWDKAMEAYMERRALLTALCDHGPESLEDQADVNMRLGLIALAKFDYVVRLMAWTLLYFATRLLQETVTGSHAPKRSRAYKI